MKLVLLTLSLALVPGVAGAAVHVDPDSPSGQEYALPLDDARGDAVGGRGGDATAVPPGGGGGGPSGGGRAGASGGESSPAFGVGLSGRSVRGAHAGTDARGKSVGGGKRRSSGGAGGAGGPGPTAVATRTAASTSAGGAGSTLLFSGLGLGTVVLGVAAGVLLRRRLRRG